MHVIIVTVISRAASTSEPIISIPRLLFPDDPSSFRSVPSQLDCGFSLRLLFQLPPSVAWLGRGVGLGRCLPRLANSRQLTSRSPLPRPVRLTSAESESQGNFWLFAQTMRRVSAHMHAHTNKRYAMATERSRTCTLVDRPHGRGCGGAKFLTFSSPTCGVMCCQKAALLQNLGHYCN